MKLQTIRVKNFKNFTSATDGGFIEIDLNGKSTVFYGSNGSGKSTLLSAVCYDALDGSGIQLVTISRPTAYGEYAPYRFVHSEEEFATQVLAMRA